MQRRCLESASLVGLLAFLTVEPGTAIVEIAAVVVWEPRVAVVRREHPQQIEARLHALDAYRQTLLVVEVEVAVVPHLLLRAQFVKKKALRVVALGEKPMGLSEPKAGVPSLRPSRRSV